MAILTCLIPAFPVALLARSDPALVEQSLAVVGPNDHVLAATPVALEGGVVLGQSARQARLACPDLLLRDVDLAACQAEFDALAGDWAFHCHMLLHMMSGMFRVVTVRHEEDAA